MVIGINQPYYLPYIGLFERIRACDLFVINPFTPLNMTRAFHRRSKIIQITPGVRKDYIYLTQFVPRGYDGKFYSEIQLDKNFWVRQHSHINTIYSTYSRAKYFSHLGNILEVMQDYTVTNLGNITQKSSKSYV